MPGSEITKHIIDLEQIQTEIYFQSLMQKALEHNIISANQANEIMMACINIFIETCESYTKGKSSSIRTEIAENIMASIAYILGYYLKSLPSIEESIDALNERPFSETYFKALKKVKILKGKIAFFYSLVKNSIMPTNNFEYNSTIQNEIKLVVNAMYREDYCLHETEQFSYIMRIELNEFTGLEYTLAYLKLLLTENQICQHFINIDGSNIFIQDIFNERVDINLLEMYIRIVMNNNSASVPVKKDDKRIVVKNISSKMFNDYKISNNYFKKHIVKLIAKIVKEEI